MRNPFRSLRAGVARSWSAGRALVRLGIRAASGALGQLIGRREVPRPATPQVQRAEVVELQSYREQHKTVPAAALGRVEEKKVEQVQSAEATAAPMPPVEVDKEPVETAQGDPGVEAESVEAAPGADPEQVEVAPDADATQVEAAPEGDPEDVETVTEGDPEQFEVAPDAEPEQVPVEARENEPGDSGDEEPEDGETPEESASAEAGSSDSGEGEDVEGDRIDAILESLLLAAGAPLTVRRMCDAIRSGPKAKEVRAALKRLKQRYSGDCGIHLEEVAGGYQFRTAPANAKYVRNLLREKPARLGRAALETLSIIAYKQPVTRGEIEAIRGVDADSAVNTLLSKKLIKIEGRKETVGRPLLYATTPEFLEIFGLKDLKDLPTLKEIGPVPEPENEEDIEEDGHPSGEIADAIVQAANGDQQAGETGGGEVVAEAQQDGPTGDAGDEVVAKAQQDGSTDSETVAQSLDDQDDDQADERGEEADETVLEASDESGDDDAEDELEELYESAAEAFDDEEGEESDAKKFTEESAQESSEESDDEEADR